MLVVLLVLGLLLSEKSTKVECRSKSKNDSLLLVVSFDGFSPLYFKRNITPQMSKFRSEGTTSDHVRNVFPTKTFPNHHSIATGLYPGEHGVVGSNIYDSSMGLLQYGPDLYAYKEDIEPIWVTNELGGGVSGCMMWPGSEFKYSNQQRNCTFQVPLNMTMSWEARLEEVVRWFQEGANFVMMYIEEPDYLGHMIGVEDEKENAMIKKLDDFTHLVEEKTRHLNLNLIFLSDHGMIDTTPSKFINLTEILPEHKEKIYGVSPVMQISPVDVDQVYKILLNASAGSGTFKVYRNSDLPESWNLKNERRTGPITVVAEPSYAFDDMWSTTDWYEKHFNITRTNTSKYGIHGYDNAVPSMHAFFMAKGPAIKDHHTVTPFDSVDLFHLFCEILDVKPPIVSGNRNNILDILRSHVPPDSRLSITMVLLIAISVSFVLFATVTALVMVRRRGRDTQIVPPFIYDEPELVTEEQKLLEISTRTIPDLKV